MPDELLHEIEYLERVCGCFYAAEQIIRHGKRLLAEARCNKEISETQFISDIELRLTDITSKIHDYVKKLEAQIIPEE